MEQPPGHGADPVEEGKSRRCSLAVDGTGSDQQRQMGVDLASRGVGDPPVADPVATIAAVAGAGAGA